MNVVSQKRHVMTCSLHVLAIVWLIAWALSHAILLYPIYNEFIITQAWTPFFFIGITITWVVLSRVISAAMRTLVFLLWCFALILMISWSAATSRTLGNGIVFGALTLACTFFFLSVATRFVVASENTFDTPSYYTTIAIVVAIIMTLFAPHLVPITNHTNEQNVFIGIAVFSVVIVVFQVWNTWKYIRANKSVNEIPNTCIFAVMAPWTETVDAFASLSRYN